MLLSTEDKAKEYEDALNLCENHIKADHHISKVNVYFSTKKSKRDELDPPLTLKDFYETFISKCKYYLTIIILYTLPFSSSSVMSFYIK